MRVQTRRLDARGAHSHGRVHAHACACDHVCAHDDGHAHAHDHAHDHVRELFFFGGVAAGAAGAGAGARAAEAPRPATPTPHPAPRIYVLLDRADDTHEHVGAREKGAAWREQVLRLRGANSIFCSKTSALCQRPN